MDRGEALYQKGRQHILRQEYAEALGCYYKASQDHHDEALFEMGRANEMRYWGIGFDNNGSAERYYRWGRNHSGCMFKMATGVRGWVDNDRHEDYFDRVIELGDPDWIELLRLWGIRRGDKNAFQNGCVALANRTLQAAIIMICYHNSPWNDVDRLEDIGERFGWADAQVASGNKKWQHIAAAHGYVRGYTALASGETHDENAFAVIERGIFVHQHHFFLQHWLLTRIKTNLYLVGRAATLFDLYEIRNDVRFTHAIAYYREEHARRKRNILLCLCAYKWDRGSLFVKLPRDVLLSLLKMYAR